MEFFGDGRETRVSEPSDLLTLGQSTVSRLSATLESFRHAGRNERIGLYRLGPGVVTLAGQPVTGEFIAV
jgi:DNA-binding IclR family transcriptional regulator